MYVLYVVVSDLTVLYKHAIAAHERLFHTRRIETRGLFLSLYHLRNATLSDPRSKHGAFSRKKGKRFYTTKTLEALLLRVGCVGCEEEEDSKPVDEQQAAGSCE
jgi:hypothetical protein